jgi:S1-C subfamily serine protease
MRVSTIPAARALLAGALLVSIAGCGAARATAQTTGASPPAGTAAPAATSAAPVATAAPAATKPAAATATSGAANAPTTATSAPATAAQSGPAAATGDPPLTQNTVIQIGKKLTPGIVQITNEQMVLQQSGRQLVPAGAGTGFVIDNQGHIVTNNHVVEQAQRLEVQTTDGKTYPAKLIGRDPRSDLAVIQVEGQSLPVVPLGDSSKLQVGQWVVAIGNALALEGGPTLTVGVVSAVGRTVQEPGSQQGPQGQQQQTQGPYLFDLVQTDAAINPGNSGGPLINLNGEVVGVNTLGSAEAQGISFAIAINTAKRIADQLISTGKVDYAFMGLNVTPNSPALAQRFGLASVPGLAVADVGANTPAARAGMQSKDVITAVDGQPMKAESDLSRFLSQKKPGDTITVSLVRPNNQKQDVQVQLATAPSA